VSRDNWSFERMQGHRLAAAGTAAVLTALLVAAASRGEDPVGRIAQAPGVPPAVAPSPNTCIPGTGSRNWCGDGRLATQAKLAAPNDVTTAPDGTIFIADTLNNVIRRVSPDGSIATVAGDGVADAPLPSEPAATASFDHPRGVAVQNDGGLLVADTGHAAIRRVAPDGTVTTVIGGPDQLGERLRSPTDVAVQPDGGYLIADAGRNEILRVTSDGRVFRSVGTGRPGFSKQPKLHALRAALRSPSQIVPLGRRDMLIADTRNGAVRWLRGRRVQTLFRGKQRIYGVALSAGRVLVSDAVGIHDVTPKIGQGQIAGTKTRGYSGDSGDALAVQLNFPGQLASAPDGTLLIAEPNSDRIRRLQVGQLVTVAGTDTPLTAAAAASPQALTAAHVPECTKRTPRFQVFLVKPLLSELRGTPQGIRVKLATSRVARVRLRLERGGRVAKRMTYDVVSNRQDRDVIVRARMRHGRYTLFVSGRSIMGPDHPVRCLQRTVRVS
jgi:DNA-binding beta-propeller fold protein YncE/uncharacterized protein YwbE